MYLSSFVLFSVHYFVFVIIIACPLSVDGGMTWPATIEGMSVEMPCSSGSSQFR